MSHTQDPNVAGTTMDLKHRPSKLDLLDSTILTSFPIPHPIKEESGSLTLGKLRAFKSYPVLSKGLNISKVHNNNHNDDYDEDEYEDDSGNFTSIIRSSTIVTPPSSTDMDTSVEFDYKAVLDESFKQVHSTPSIEKCNDAYLRSILSDKKDFGTLHYCSFCDSPLYELSGLIPDDLQHRELICQGCSGSTNNDADNDDNDDTCTMQIVDELDMTLQSEDEFNTTTIIRDGSTKFQAIISNLKSISTRDLRLRQSMVNLNSNRSNQDLWTMVKGMLFGTTSQ